MKDCSNEIGTFEKKLEFLLMHIGKYLRKSALEIPLEMKIPLGIHRKFLLPEFAIFSKHIRSTYFFFVKLAFLIDKFGNISINLKAAT